MEYVKDIQTGVAFGSSLYGKGTELHDSTGAPIGYMGIFYLDGRYAFSEIEASRLEDASRQVEIALSYPSETFHQLSEE